LTNAFENQYPENPAKKISNDRYDKKRSNSLFDSFMIVGIRKDRITMLVMATMKLTKGSRVSRGLFMKTSIN